MEYPNFISMNEWNIPYPGNLVMFSL